MKEMTKTFQKAGKWVEKKTRAQILVCECGNKYLKTRPRQKECVRCMFKNSASR